ncbi:cell-wall invertase, partial [Genlisea aurea]
VINGVDGSHKIFPHLQSVPAFRVDEDHKTGFHFQPTKHWINDPNGPMYFNGFYHLFYQYNPKGAVWGNIVWAHSVSKDLISWKKLPPAIYPSENFDRYGCWSGSATVLPGNRPVILYTGVVDSDNTQVQDYAVPANVSDPFLREWVKPGDNPVIVADGSSINKTAFRDPTTAWRGADGLWRTVVGSREGETGVAYLFRSRDFAKWEKADRPLHSAAGTGNWECPDFFPVQIGAETGLDTTAPAAASAAVKHVFKVSLDATRYEYYTLGQYDAAADVFVPDRGSVDGLNGLRYDYGNFYASKSFFDPVKSRRILWGWANESDTTDDDVKKGWAGVQAIPRTVTVDPNGKQLLQWPVEEVESLRGHRVDLNNIPIQNGSRVEITGITPVQADVDVTFSFESLDHSEPFNRSWDRYDAQRICGQKGSWVHGGVGPFGIATLASENLEEYTPVFFRIFRDHNGSHLVLLCSDASRSSTGDPKTRMKDGKDAYRPSFAGFVDVDLKSRMKLSLRSLIDTSVVESFAEKGKTVITSRVYPRIAIYDKARLYVFNNGTETVTVEKLTAWSMNKPKFMNH